MKRPGILAAAALVVVADAYVVARAAMNRSGDPTAIVELTERELRLARPNRESTALFLRLEWEPSWRTFRFEDGPGWFDRAKLEQLGWDCRVPAADSAAASHYRAMPSKRVFAVLEFRASPAENPSWSNLSQLTAVDAGYDYAALRLKYAGARFLVVPALAKLRFETPPAARGGIAFLRGAVDQILVSEISVPPSQRHVFEPLSDSDTYLQPSEKRPPRYAVTLHYGRHHEPWIAASRRLP